MTALIRHISHELEIDDLENSSWTSAESIEVSQYWSGEPAPSGRHFEARLLWSETTLYVRFAARQNESLIISEVPNTHTKTMGLWERDVCEIFLAPDALTPHKYFEFEIAPTGEWLDLAIEIRETVRFTDWKYSSALRSAASIANDSVTMATSIPFSSLGKIPKVDDIWLGNIFRCVGAGSTRGFLAWQPTLTDKPNFHVPQAFGRFLFTS